MPIRHTDRAIDQIGSKGFARVAVSIVLVAGVGTSLALFAATRAQDEASFQFAFTREGRQAISTLKEGIDSHLEVLRALEAFYRSSEDITRQEFRTFAGVFLRHGRGVQAVEWIPLVRQSDRETFERNAQRQELPHYQFTELDKTGKLTRAGTREEYYPVYYAEPRQANEAAIGFDLRSDPARKQTLERSRDSGQLTASPPLRLVQETVAQQGLLVVLPVYRKGAVTDSVLARREHIEGFFLVAIRAKDFLSHILLPNQSLGIDLYVYDRSEQSSKDLLFSYSFNKHKGTAKHVPGGTECALAVESCAHHSGALELGSAVRPPCRTTGRGPMKRPIGWGRLFWPWSPVTQAPVTA